MAGSRVNEGYATAEEETSMEEGDKSDTLRMTEMTRGGQQEGQQPALPGGYFGPPAVAIVSSTNNNNNAQNQQRMQLKQQKHEVSTFDRPNPWKRAADWFEFLSFLAYFVGFVAFAVWYWTKLVDSSEQYKHYIPNFD